MYLLSETSREDGYKEDRKNQAWQEKKGGTTRHSSLIRFTGSGIFFNSWEITSNELKSPPVRILS